MRTDNILYFRPLRRWVLIDHDHDLAVREGCPGRTALKSSTAVGTRLDSIWVSFLGQCALPCEDTLHIMKPFSLEGIAQRHSSVIFNRRRVRHSLPPRRVLLSGTPTHPLIHPQTSSKECCSTSTHSSSPLARSHEVLLYESVFAPGDAADVTTLQTLSEGGSGSIEWFRCMYTCSNNAGSWAVLSQCYLHSLDDSALHGRVLPEIPPEFTPYRRLLAVRAFKCGSVHCDTALLSLVYVQVPQEVASLHAARSR